jgi:sigma-B regulation protein RsbU (phosphoserine phosphatase)
VRLTFSELKREVDCFAAGLVACGLRPGDRLVMFTDGVSEAVDENGQEFGEKRLVEASLRARQLSAKALHNSILDLVTEFCDGEFDDDATVLVVAVS